MDFIDDEGNLLGLVNVVDAFAMLLVVAVIIAGTTFFLQPHPTPTPSATPIRYATLDLGAQPAYLATLIHVGDAFSPKHDSNLTVTDVYSTDQGNQRHVLVRVKIQGTTADGTIAYDGAPPRVGRKLTITTPQYTVAGPIVAVGTTSHSLDLQQTPVLLATTLSADAASHLHIGDKIRRANHTVATIDDFVLYETNDQAKRRAVVLTTLLAHRTQQSLTYGSTPLRVGKSVELSNAGYDVGGTILRVGIDQLPTSTTDVLLRGTLPTTVASELHVGDTYAVNGHPVATIESITAYGTGNPDMELVYAGVSYRTYQPRDQPLFAGQVVRAGIQLPFHNAAYSFDGRVVRMGALEQTGLRTTQTVTLELKNVDPELADSLHAGMTERIRGGTIAKLDDVSVEPAKMVVTTQDGRVYLRDNPLKKDVTIRATLQVRQDGTSIRFKGTTIRQGTTITLELENVTIRPTVVRL